MRLQLAGGTEDASHATRSMHFYSFQHALHSTDGANGQELNKMNEEKADSSVAVKQQVAGQGLDGAWQGKLHGETDGRASSMGKQMAGQGLNGAPPCCVAVLPGWCDAGACMPCTSGCVTHPCSLCTMHTMRLSCAVCLPCACP